MSGVTEQCKVHVLPGAVHQLHQHVLAAPGPVSIHWNERLLLSLFCANQMEIEIDNMVWIIWINLESLSWLIINIFYNCLQDPSLFLGIFDHSLADLGLAKKLNSLTSCCYSPPVLTISLDDSFLHCSFVWLLDIVNHWFFSNKKPLSTAVIQFKWSLLATISHTCRWWKTNQPLSWYLVLEMILYQFDQLLLCPSSRWTKLYLIWKWLILEMK